MKLKLSKKKKIILLVVLVLIVAVVALKACGGSEEAGALPTATIPLTKQDMEETLTLKAPLEGTESVEVVSRLHYEVLDLRVKEGDHVQKGQILAVLNQETLSDEVERAEDALKLATLQYEENLDNSQREYEKAVQSRDDAQKRYDRLNTLFEEGGESLENLEAAASTLADAQRAVDAFSVKNGQVVGDESARKQLEIDRKALDQKKQDLEECEIESPIDGTVTRVNIKVGRFADDTDDDKPMFVIENVGQLQMQVSVSEFDIAKVKEGQTVKIGADILGKDTVDGVVARISPTGEAKGDGTNERVIPTIIQVTGEDARLIAGITASATIQIAQAQGVFVVPVGAVVENPDGSCQVYRVSAQNTIEIIPVTIGLETDVALEVQSDSLREGDQIVVAPNAGMTEGMPVTVPAAAQ